VPGVAVIVTIVPSHTVALFTLTVGLGLIVTVPEAEVLIQPVAVLVIITLYTPAIVVVKVATLPGLAAPVGTVHA
jgi:hypothetical protein